MIYSSSEENGQTIILTEHLYDRQNRIDKQTYQLRNGNGTFTTYVSDYSYRAADGALTYVDSVNGNFGDYGFEYDDIARLSARYNYYFRQDYDYLYVENGLTTTETTSQTSTQIGKIDYSARTGGTQFSPFSLTYTYDELGNIGTITGTGISGQNAAYDYDAQGQLILATTNGVTRKYIYDTYGNIREIRDANDNTLHSYTYGNADWKDLLTAYDSENITYDQIGNPLSYYNGTRWDFGWEKGRQLVSAESDDHEIEYTYDMAGIRDSKTVDGVTYNYLTLDGKVVRQTWTDSDGKHTVDFIYDNSGLPYAFKYGGGYYIYVLNQQGDVIRIVNSTGATVAEYKYDAWGKILSITEFHEDSIGAVNPIRYRGYYYDTETGFYYLQSRYYDPSIGRHLNSDTVFDYDTGFPGYNLFAYCGNCPVFRIDCCGRDSEKCDDVNEFDQMEELGGGGGNPMPLPANGSSGGGIWDSLKNSIKNAMSGLEMAMGEREGIERHHFLTNKSQTYTDDFAEKAARYQLDLDDDWNTEVLINHRGRHTNAYHDYMANHLDQIIAVAKDDPALFLEGFGILRQSVIDNPGLLYARYLK